MSIEAQQEYVRVNYSLGRGALDERFPSRREAAELFRRVAADPALQYVEAWDCDEQHNTAVKIWDFTPPTESATKAA